MRWHVKNKDEICLRTSGPTTGVAADYIVFEKYFDLLLVTL